MKEGLYVRCPIDIEYPEDPRYFAMGRVVSIDTFNETAHIVFYDPFNNRLYLENIPEELKEVPLSVLEPCHVFKGTKVKYNGNTAVVVEYKIREEGYDYYIRDLTSKQIYYVGEEEIDAPFSASCVKPSVQLANYEFQNPCWYLGRQIVKNTMNVLDNSIFGFKELAGCKIYLKAFQINTIMRCLQEEHCRYMLADEVGLGKTIEACSVLKIFISKETKQNILICVPKALIAQWKTELLFKFGIVEGVNIDNNKVTISSIEDLSIQTIRQDWDFVIVDEVHNYIFDNDYYTKIHALSRNTSNILLLSATPIQQRKHEYLKLLRLILPEKYDSMTENQFETLVVKQGEISRQTHIVLDAIDSLKTEVLPDIEEDPHEDEDVQELLEEICDGLNDILNLINDEKLEKMIKGINTEKDDLGLFDIHVIVAYICDNFQIEKNIIRGRRAILGVYPEDEDAEFATRKLIEIKYSLDDECTYYENEAYRTLKNWILTYQNKLDNETVLNKIRPIMEAFFSSPWAYKARIEEILGKENDLDEVRKSAARWVEYENESVQDMANVLDETDAYTSRLVKLISYIDTELFEKKVVIFTNQKETFDMYYQVLKTSFGDEVTAFGKSIDRDEAEINMYRFQSDSNCNILLCDYTGGEGRNLQMADYVIHVDLPWDINTIEQRIGRLDRMGRDVKVPVTSVVIHTVDSYEDQLFDFWNQALNVFCQSLSGLEIIMSDINSKIVDSIKSDFEFGLYRLIPELIKEAKEMREMVYREQMFDTAAVRYKPLYNQLKILLNNYQFNENELFSQTMMSWASLAGFLPQVENSSEHIVSFNESGFSVRSAQNSYLVPPCWDNYINKKQNEVAIKVQRGIEIEKEKNTNHDNRTIKGTFDRDAAIKNDYIHFFAPGDEIFDCITNNALCSYKGMATAFAAESSVEWKGFVYTFSIEPNERLLLDQGVSLYTLGSFRQYLATSIQTVIVPFNSYKDIPEKTVIAEHQRLMLEGYFNEQDGIEHLGRRGYRGSFLNIPRTYSASNIDWFRARYPEERWKQQVEQSSQIARKHAQERFKRESDLAGAREMIEEIISTNRSRNEYFDIEDDQPIESLISQYDLIYKSLSKPIVRMESACFMWLVKING